MIVDGQVGIYKKTVKNLFELAGKVLNEDFSEVNVSINFVEAEEIRQLNKKFRDIDRATDVLSFPNLEKSPNQKLQEFEEERNFDDNLLFLGDIVICKEVAVAQAKEFGHSQKREVCFLALHGLLHLLGYDHIEKADEKIMQEVANKILDSAGVCR
ncbi:MAG: rRNA maturation RNase YbeY [Clostridia bacterium]|nr:rRNA maturation RNase YbeY [Clostridia bacterium]